MSKRGNDPRIEIVELLPFLTELQRATLLELLQSEDYTRLVDGDKNKPLAFCKLIP